MSIIKNNVTGFIEFIRGRGIIGFAIGFIMGKAVSDLVNAFVTDFVSPTVGLLLGGIKNLAEMSFSVMGAVYKYGDFANVFINFFAITLITYIIFKSLRLERLDKSDK